MILGRFRCIKHCNFLEFITWLERGWFVLLTAVTPFLLEANPFTSLWDGEGYFFLVCFGFHLWIRLRSILNFQLKIRWKGNENRRLKAKDGCWFLLKEGWFVGTHSPLSWGWAAELSWDQMLKEIVSTWGFEYIYNACVFSVWSSFLKSSVNPLPPALLTPESGIRLLVSLRPGQNWGVLLGTGQNCFNDTQQLSVSQPHCGGCCEHFTFHFIAADQILVFTARMCAI